MSEDANREKIAAKVLPLDAARLLQKAAQTPIPAHDPLARVKAIDKATALVKRMYPKYFRE